MQLKELSQEAKEAIIHERNRNGPFTSVEDFLERTGSHTHLQDARILIKAGCFDSVACGNSRAGLMWEALRFFDQKEEEKAPSLFSSSISPSPLKSPYPRLSSPRRDLHRVLPYAGGRSHHQIPSPSYSKCLMRKHELETLGFYVSIHPLDLYRNALTGLDHVRAKHLHGWAGKEVTAIGWQITGKTVLTKEGEAMKFVSFEDSTGIYETVFFPKAYHRFCHMLSASRPYILKGRVEEDFGAITLNVHWIGFLDDYKKGGSQRHKYQQ